MYYCYFAPSNSHGYLPLRKGTYIHTYLGIKILPVYSGSIVITSMSCGIKRNKLFLGLTFLYCYIFLKRTGTFVLLDHGSS